MATLERVNAYFAQMGINLTATKISGPHKGPPKYYQVRLVTPGGGGDRSPETYNHIMEEKWEGEFRFY